MKRFNKRIVKDRVVRDEDLFEIRNATPISMRLIPRPTVTQEGTVINKGYLQPIEDYLDVLETQDGHLQDTRGVVASQGPLNETINNVNTHTARLDYVDTTLSNHDRKIMNLQSTTDSIIETNEIQDKKLIDLDERLTTTQIMMDDLTDFNEVQDERLYTIEAVLTKHKYTLEQILNEFNELLPDNKKIKVNLDDEIKIQDI